VFHFVHDRLLRGDPPSIREVQRALGFRAVQTAKEHLDALVAEGRLEQAPGRARGLRLPRRDRPTPMMRIPLLGRVQAGALTTAFEEVEGYVPIQTRLPREELFALRVRGQSMRDAGILEGDIVVVRKQGTAGKGDIVVALVEDEATVKTLDFEGKRPVLVPANPDFEVLRPEPESLLVLGRVVEVRRVFDAEVVE
jgi:repressor LexA